MRSSMLVLAALVMGTAQYVAAGDPPSGTISCVAEGDLIYQKPYLPAGMAAPLTRSMRFQGLTNGQAPCDASGVVGGRLPIIAVQARFGGKFGPGTTCQSFLGTVALTGKVKLRWLGNNHGTYATVGTSNATVASATFDSGTESWMVVTNPVKGAFAGSTVTMHFGMYDVASYEEICLTSDFRFAGWRATAGNPWLIDVQ